jgi:hypothetical protein
MVVNCKSAKVTNIVVYRTLLYTNRFKSIVLSAKNKRSKSILIIIIIMSGTTARMGASHRKYGSIA